MKQIARLGAIPTPALTRLAGLTPLDPHTTAALRHTIDQAVRVRPRAELVTRGKEIKAPLLIVEGWAARTQIMVDGRRQFQSFLLPGDFIGLCRQSRPVAVSTVAALTEMLVATPPPADVSPALAEVYAVSQALEEAYLLAHIVRLGRLHAQERLLDLLLELHERLSLAGMADDGRFEAPLTQEMLGDALGLTSVHINRMLQLVRRQGQVVWRGRIVTLPDPAALARTIGRRPVQVTADQPIVGG